MRGALSTYRLQVHGAGGLAGARRLVPYLRRLGVTHLYCAPILRARRGSAHGYDGVDPSQVDPALGGERALGRLAGALSARGMGLLLDVVPNHLAADAENPAFDDVLAHGPASRFAAWFDVDWGTPGATEPARLVLPALAEPLARELARDRLRVVRVGGEPRLRYHERSFPLDPRTLPGVIEDALVSLRRAGAGPGAERKLAALALCLGALPPRARSDARSVATRAAARARAHAELGRVLGRSARLGDAFDAALARFGHGAAGRRRLARLLEGQAYRLADWRRGRRVLNYRRFFDVNELVALRVEDPRVFAATHAKLLELVAHGWIGGLRVDHVDGLLDPGAYLRRLRAAAESRLPAVRRGRFLLVVEKILAHGEPLPPGWPVAGTTGYEFLNQLEAALLSPQGVAEVEATWSRFSGIRRSFDEVARAGKRRALRDLLDADVQRLARLGAAELPGIRVAELRRAIVETIAQTHVYRAYRGPRGALSQRDRAVLERALDGARRERRAPQRGLAALAGLLLGSARARQARPSAARDEFVRRFQQLSGPAAAKGVEDTAFYVHVPLLSRNEVGGEPGSALAGAVTEFHVASRTRARRWPHSLLATSTHDTKRSADVRARLDVLAEVPHDWRRALARWGRWNRPLRRRVGRRLLPDANTEYLLYQTLVGIWPLPRPDAGRRALPNCTTRAELGKRLVAYAEKAAREAKRHTSWIDPDRSFESALRAFARRLLEPARSSNAVRFLDDLAAFADAIARPGLWNALARTLVHLTAPGTPDLYQGDELWSFTLVDPDNRRPVDFARRRRLLAAVERGVAASPTRRAAFLRDLVARAEDGRIKLHVIRATLAVRRREPTLFGGGEYLPLEARGARAEHALAFARRTRGRIALTVVSRLPRTLVADATRAPTGRAIWSDTVLRLPRALAGRSLVSPLTRARLAVPRGPGRKPELPVAALLADLPVGLWIARTR